jgi:hypothetical protein
MRTSPISRLVSSIPRVVRFSANEPGPRVLLLDAFGHEERNLPVGEAEVGVSPESLPGDELGRRDGRFDLAFFPADIDGQDFPGPAGSVRGFLRGSRVGTHAFLRKTPLLPPLLYSSWRPLIRALLSTALTMS